MDPAHRDRIAFVRICSGKFTRGMQLKIGRTGKSMRTASAMSFLSQRRELLEEAYAGDIIGLPNHGLLQLGDTLTEGEKLQYTGLPFFAPEIFQAVEVADPMAVPCCSAQSVPFSLRWWHIDSSMNMVLKPV